MKQYARLSMIWPWLFTVIGLCLSAFIALAPIGCATTATVATHKPATAAEAAQQAIDELNVAIAAAATELIDQYHGKRVTEGDFRDARDTLNTAREYRDQASALLAAGDLTTAAGKARAATLLLGVVQKRLVAIKEGNKP